MKPINQIGELSAVEASQIVEMMVRRSLASFKKQKVKTVYYRPPLHMTPRIGETPLKVWRLNEAMRLGIGYTAVVMRHRRGKYPQLKIRRVNHSVQFVIQ
jgi:hypothetical protein